MRVAIRILTFLGGLGGGLALGAVFLGSTGARVASARCEAETSDEWFPCLDEAVGGFVAASAFGAIGGVLAWWLLWRLWARSQASPYSTTHVIALIGLFALGLAGCLGVVALLAGSPLAGLVVLAVAVIVILARGVRRDYSRGPADVHGHDVGGTATESERPGT